MKTLSKRQILMLHNQLVAQAELSDVILQVAAGELDYAGLLNWLIIHQS